MPIAVNPSTGETVFLDDAGAWKPAQTAVNPQTKEMLAFDGKTWAPVPAQSKGVLGYIDDAVRSMAQGATFGWADEIAARGNALIGQGTYEQNIQQERARDKQISPYISIPGQIAGGIGSMIAAGPAVAPLAARAGLTALPKAAQYIGLGAGTGAVQGAGEAEEGGRVAGAAGGAAIGGFVGAVAPKVVQGVANTVQAVRGAFSPTANVSADLGRAIVRDADTPAALAARLAEAQAERPGVATIADVGKENVRGLLERVAQTPGAGRTTVVPALTQRQQGQMGRLSNDLRELTGTRQTAMQAIDQTMAGQVEAAAPLYQQAYEAGDRAIWSPVLERLSSSPTIQAAMRGAVRVWRDVAVAEGYGGMNPGALVDRGGQLSFLNGRVPVFPNLQFWDYTKRIIDDQISTAVRAGQNQKVRTLTSLQNTLRNELDTQVPAYSQARAAWAGPARYLDAIEEGRNILSPRVAADEFAARVASLSTGEQEAIRIGAVSSIIGKMGTDAAKLGDMTKYLRSPEVRAKIAAIMPDEETAARFMQRLDFEVSASELTGRSLGNSATARRLAEGKDAESLTADLVMSALSGHARSVWSQFVGAIPGRIRDTLRSRSDARLADVLLQAQDARALNQVLSGAARAGQPVSDAAKMGGVIGGNALLNY